MFDARGLPPGSVITHRADTPLLRHGILTFLLLVALGAETWLVVLLLRSRASLRTSESRYRQMVEHADLLVTRVDTRRALTFLNARAVELFGRPAADCLGRDALDFVHPDDRMPTEAWLASCIARRVERSGTENRLILADGAVRTLSWTCAFSYAPEGRLLGIDSFARDITELVRSQLERARLEEQLRQTQRIESLGRLAGGVAHDLNNLLSPILGYSELLLAEGASEPQRDRLAQIMAAATRARNLVRQLLAFGRNQVLSLDVVDLGEIVVGFEPLLHRATREDIRIVVEREERPVWVRADVTQMEQVLLNLAVNARDAMPNEGTLRLAVAASEDHAIASLVVADTGIGMSPEIREHIFEPFFTTKEQGLGHGLGLATVFGIVTQHGGRITVDSEPGIGSRFVVSLPCAAAPQRRLPTPSVTAPGGRHDSASILVVEDDPAMLRLVVTMITQLGYTHFTAPGADAAVAIAGDRSNDFDLLLSDIIMPGCNGPDLYARLRIDRPSLRVLYMSGYNEDVLPLEDSTRKRPSILQKPFSLDALSKAILEALVRDS